MIWYPVVASFALAVLAIVRRAWVWVLVSGLLYAPLALYLSATPRFRWAWLTLLCYPLSAYTLKRGQPFGAWLMLVLPVALSVWVALLALFQPSPS